jgi:hypothetical protein
MLVVLLLLAAVTFVVIRYGVDSTESSEWRWNPDR